LATLFVSHNSYSSSLLPNSSINLYYHPDVTVVSDEVVKVYRLDSCIGSIVPDHGLFGLKIDVQGSELSVLEGAKAVVDRISLLVIELSLLPMQEGQSLIYQIMPSIIEQGFSPVIIEPCDTNPNTFEILQLDIWFVKSSNVV
jgi:hypothetical protein